MLQVVRYLFQKDGTATEILPCLTVEVLTGGRTKLPYLEE